MTEQEEKEILAEIEQSFCVAGYEVIESEVFQECIREEVREA